MANTFKYKNVDWAEGTPVAGERLATNAHYTGEFKGTVMQDAKGTTEANAPHYIEGAIVRLGTILGDALDPNFPEVEA